MVEQILPELSSRTLTIRPSIKGTPDAYIWTQRESGIYTAKSGYFSAQVEKIQSTSVLLNLERCNWQKYIWSPKLLPKFKFFLWKCAQNILPTGGNLRKRGLLVNTLCTRCGEEESIEHLLFHCSFAEEVWGICPWSTALELHSYTFFKTALQNSISKTNLPPTGTSSNLFPWICWHIWTALNQLIFQNRNTTARELTTKTIASLKEWDGAQVLNPLTSIIISPETSPRLNPTESIICSTDAAWDSDTKTAGLAWIFTDQASTVVARGCSFQEHVSSPLMAEALSIRSALQHVASIHPSLTYLASIRLQGACTSHRRSIELYGVLANIESLISSYFAFLHVSFIPKNLNWVCRHFC